MTAVESPATPKIDPPPQPKEIRRASGLSERGAFDSVTDSVAGLFSFNAKLLEAYSEAGRAYVKQLSAMSEELTAFTNRRLKEQAQVRDSLARCKDWGDALRMQQEWFQDASKEYLEEATRLFGMISQATLAGVGPLMEKMETLPQQFPTSKSPTSRAA